MLRNIDVQGGTGIYAQNLMDHLLPLDTRNEYVLFFRTARLLGRYARYPQVRAKLVEAPNKAIWDQVKIPLEADREKVDLIFHPKFTVPLLARQKAVMTLHGSSWFVHPELWSAADLLYAHGIVRLYCRKAAAILSNSDVTTRNFVRYLNVSAGKCHTAHFAADDRFEPVHDAAALKKARERYRLPERFMLMVTSYERQKNFKNLIEAFAICRARVPCALVVVGAGCERYRDEYRLRDRGLDGDVVFPGWVEQHDLPCLYSLAEFMVFPSIYEGFGIPVCEAMSCGCPVVVSSTGALPEIAADAGVYVDPMNPADIAEALLTLWTDRERRKEWGEKARLRSRAFSWDRCARQTLAVLESLEKSARM